MKYLSILGLVLLLASCNRDRIVIRGEYAAGEGRMIFLDQIEPTLLQTADSSNLDSRGRFRFVFHANQPQFLSLRINDQEHISLLAEPGEKILVSAAGENLSGPYQVDGSPGSTLVKELETGLNETTRALDSLRTLYGQAAEQEGNDGRLSELETEFNELVKKQRQASIRFILEHSGSLASYMVIYQKLDPETYVLNSTYDIQYMKIVTDSLSKYYPRSKYTRALKTDLEAQMNNLRSLQMKNIISNMESKPIDVALPNVAGDTLRLSSLRGNYTLLSFWSTFSAESMQENQDLRGFYRKYHPKGFQVYQVVIDTSLSLVKKILDYEAFPWAVTIDTGFDQSMVARMLNVQNLPSNFLVDPKGEFIDRDLFGEELRQKLSQIYD